GSPARLWIAWLVAFTMAPVLQLLKMGQISGLLFLGITAFLYFHQKKKGWLAGLSVGLLFIKPHTLFLFLAVYALWCLKTRSWSYIGGTLLALTGATLIAVAVNPLVLGQYIQAMPLITLNIFFPATWGTLLRMIFGQDKFWLQYIPPVLGLVWLLWYWWKNRKTWEWIDHLPLLIFVSAITTAYGWVCDQTVIVLPMIGMSVVFFQGKWTSKKAIIVGVYILINCVAAFLRVLQVYFFWLSAAYLILYLVARPDKKEPRVNLEPIPTESLSS
ncbi:MAG TPA: glycosyltransferase family 87 protein, partial [Anaerolineaceae bacterium]